ncbi:MAG TPA: hypothetical protein VN213_21190, partial [Solirubrobacteraceae bacterium]|nr:hypothetical protein [Solirubrobacteraceae bacterium]
MEESRQSAGAGVGTLVIEAVESLPGADGAGIVRVRGRWAEAAHRAELPVLCVRAGSVVHRFESLPDARFGRDPAVWRATYLVPAELIEPGAGALSVVWPDGTEGALPAEGGRVAAASA